MPRGTQRHAYRSQVVPSFHQQNHTRTWADWRLVNPRKTCAHSALWC
jgi:hypothetical protein